MLFLNAAVCETEYKLTEDNMEMMFQVNHLAQFYLARLLTRPIVNTADSRVVVLSCEAHRFVLVLFFKPTLSRGQMNNTAFISIHIRGVGHRGIKI